MKYGRLELMVALVTGFSTSCVFSMTYGGIFPNPSGWPKKPPAEIRVAYSPTSVVPGAFGEDEYRRLATATKSAPGNSPTGKSRGSQKKSARQKWALW